MSYISMAMPIGPWIAPTIVLFVMFIMRVIGLRTSNESLALITAAGSVGGIVATGFGFSFPTLYFVDPTLFNEWLATPWYFALHLGLLALSAGALGIWIADFFEHTLIVHDALPFPIGHLVYKMIAVHNSVRKAYELIIGFVITLVATFLQDGMFAFRGIIPKTITLIPSFAWQFWRFPLLQFDLWPLLWAIGFITGHVIAQPLAIGLAARILLLDPLNRFLFSSLSCVEFLLAFCSGMVLYGVVLSFKALPAACMRWITLLYKRDAKINIMQLNGYSTQQLIEIAVIVLGTLALLSYFSFPFLSQGYLLLMCFIFTYQVAVIAGTIGLAPLGRFATFVMVPAMLLFSLNILQIVIIATFVEVCAGVAADILFGRKLGRLAQVDHARLKRYQYLGLVVSALVIGAVFWFLITHFTLGSAQLCAYKAQSRQLLINAHHFDWYVLLLGACFSFLLSFGKASSMLILGGLLMPYNISLGLIFGGMLTYCVRSREEWEPFWSGVFAANSLWMLLRAMLGC